MNELQKRIALQLIYQGCELETGRFTTDFPINSEVWLLFIEGRRFSLPQSVLLTPHLEAGMTGLRRAATRAVRSLADLSNDESLHAVKRLPITNDLELIPGEARTDRYIAASESHLLVRISFFELLKLLPLTRWWKEHIANAFQLNAGMLTGLRIAELFLRSPSLARRLGAAVLDHIKDEASAQRLREIGPDLASIFRGEHRVNEQNAIARLINIAALQVALSFLGMEGNLYSPAGLQQRAYYAARRVLREMAQCFPIYLRHLDSSESNNSHISPLWQVSCNRKVEHAVVSSRKTIKADAAIRVFDTGGAGVRWAIIDSGIDARHPALARAADLNPQANIVDGLCLPSLSRIVKTLDFTRLAAITSGRLPNELLTRLIAELGEDVPQRIALIRRDLANGRMLDWTAIEPLLLIGQSDPAHYIPPVDSHGTHVAGVIGANWLTETYVHSGVAAPPVLVRPIDLCGVCPDIELLDLRVFSQEQQSDEFAILGALQYLRFLNQSKDRQYVHGVNLSLSLRHDVRNYACGSTPVCLECDRLTGSGVVVVAAAGNFGYDQAYANLNIGGAYRGLSITDPGNAASVITVGATHRTDPYRYGVSYFSSRGPTGDGRSKPDLVAPGEKILSTAVGGGLATLDGTSMSAPHVSGAAALLLSRNNELMGKPEAVKDILCRTASDLGRERAFQGAGLLDTLRALQAV